MKIIMRHLSSLAKIGLISSLRFSAMGQGSFVNLDFEGVISPLVPQQGDGRVLVQNALPGWSAWVGTNREDLVLYDNFFLDSTGIGLVDSNAPGGPGPFQGRYTMFLQSLFLFHSPPIRADASLSQVGFVPTTAQSLRFQANADGPFQVALNGQPISLVPLGTGSGFTLYGGDVSAFAGQQAELRFTALNQYNYHMTMVAFDSISFSSVPVVPEPGVLALVICGGFGLVSLRLATRGRR